MLDELNILSRQFLDSYNRPYKRYFLARHDLDERFLVVTGARGVGKTTMLAQFLSGRERCLYVPSDHVLLTGESLYRVAEEFRQMGGKRICFDEIHKVPDWTRELKSIYDTFPDLKILASGSSALSIGGGAADIGRRAVFLRMEGMSFREYLEMKLGMRFEPISLESLINGHIDLSRNIVSAMEKNDLKVLPLFRDYLERGYFPYSLEFRNSALYQMTLESNVRTALESDLPSVHEGLTGSSVRKIRKLLSIIAGSVPFTPDLKAIRNLTEIGDERTLKNYMKYIEDAGIIRTISAAGRGMRELEKPEKIYLQNPNLAFALTSGNSPGFLGNIRETFFLSAFLPEIAVRTASKGDFIIDNRYLVEVGGKGKGFDQLNGNKDAILALDGLETGAGNKIPLWLFGFLY